MIIQRCLVSRFSAPTNTVRAVFTGTLALVLSCTDATPRGEGDAFEPSGHIVLGDRSARFWGLGSGVRYPELARTSLPQIVAKSANPWVAAYRYDLGCTRYFQAEALFLVAATASCAESRANGARREHVEIVAFDSAGGAVRVSISNSWDEAMTLTPREGANSPTKVDPRR